MTKHQEVTQADRDAAADYNNGHDEEDADIRAGRWDDTGLVASYASHRISSTRQLEAQNAELVEALEQGELLVQGLMRIAGPADHIDVLGGQAVSAKEWLETLATHKEQA